MNRPPPRANQGEESSLLGSLLADRYRVIARLGQGGMGAVYLAEHVTIGKKFAVKVLSPKFAGRPDLVQRFMREARATSMISQHNVIEISDFGETPDGSVFFVMEYLEGEDLRALLKREGPVPWPRVRHMTVQICRALDAAHAAGVIHRDMKPDNCFRLHRGRDQDYIKVLDFGIAKIQSNDELARLTKTGMIFGTAKYMSPEQARGNSSDPRIDVYAVGIIMYELLSGRTPFIGKDFAKVLTKHLFDKPEPPSHWAPQARIPPEAEAIVLKALLKDPNLRFQSMAEMITALEAAGTSGAMVEVAQESLMRPDMSGSMSYRGAVVSPGSESATAMSSASHPITQPGPPPATEAPDSNRMVLIAGIGGLAVALCLAVAGVVVAGGSDEDEDGSDEAAVAAAEPVEAETPASPAAEAAPTEAEAGATATLHFETNVRAAVLDAQDRGRYGFTDDEAGIAFPLAGEPLHLILVAEGYEELEIEAIPNRESKHFSYELELADDGKPRRPSKKSKSKKSKSKKSKSRDKTTINTVGPAESEMKNPFD